MKHFKLFVALFAMLALGVGNTWAETATLEFTKQCGGKGIDSQGNNWSVTSDAAESNFDSNKGIHYGTSSKAVSYLQLSTSSIPGTITKVVVNASGASGTFAKLNVTVGESSFGDQKSLTNSATDYTFEGTAEGEIIVKLSQSSAKKALYIKSISVTYVVEENPDAVKYSVTTNVNDPAMGKVIGAGEYEEGKTATLTAVPNPAYKFVNWSNGSTDNPLKITVTEDVEVTANFEAIPPMTCAEAADAAKDATVVLNPFDVVYVVKDAGYIYIKDESGVNLIFDYNLAKDLKAGDHVEGFVGVSSPYNGLPELKPSVAFADLTVTQGTAPEPTVFTDAPVQADVNKYVKFENVTLTANATFNADGATNATMIVNGKNVTLRNNFKLAATLSQYKAYDIVGFVAIYYSDIQVYFLSATEVADLEREEYTISWSVNGTIKETTTVLEGDKLVLPTAPAAPDACSEKVFVGWATTSTVNADGSEIEYVTSATVPTESTTYYAVFATQEGEGGAAEVVDVLNRDMTGVEGTSYTSWADVSATSTAVYAGQSAGGNEAIQLRSNNSNSGVISTTSGGKLAKITVTWNSNNTSGRTLNVYGSNTAYTSPTELYGDASGEKLGAIVFGTSTELVIEGDYTYVGLRSNSGAIYLDEVQITWSVGAAATYTNYSTTCDGTSTDIENIAVEGKAVKAIVNGQLIIVKDGVKFNAIGQVIK